MVLLLLLCYSFSVTTPYAVCIIYLWNILFHSLTGRLLLMRFQCDIERLISSFEGETSLRTLLGRILHSLLVESCQTRVPDRLSCP